MKKLIFTLAIVALSGSSLFGIQRHQPRPIAPSQKTNVTAYDGPQKASVTAYDDPRLQDCLAEGRTLQECRDMVHGSGFGDAGKGVTHY